MNKTFEMNGFSADYLTLAHRLLPGKHSDKLARRCMDACTTRAHFYHIRRGLPIPKLPPLVSGADCRRLPPRKPGPLARRLLAHPPAAGLTRSVTKPTE